LDQRRRLVTDRLVDLRPPRRELLGRKVGCEKREALLGTERSCKSQDPPSDAEQAATKRHRHPPNLPGALRKTWAGRRARCGSRTPRARQERARERARSARTRPRGPE